MPDILTKPRAKTKPKTERPKFYKVILINDDFTPRCILRAVGFCANI